MDRLQLTFLAVIVAQAAHSLEEYRGRLYDVFPPARFVSGAITSDRERGFVALNVLILAFGAWCWFWPVRRHWPSAIGLAWVWAVVEALNGIGHPAWSVMRGGYTPGVEPHRCFSCWRWRSRPSSCARRGWMPPAIERRNREGQSKNDG